MRSPYQALLANPDRLREVVAAARLERSQAVYRHLVAPVARWFTQLPSMERHRLQRRSAYC